MTDTKKPNIGGHPVPTENVHHENTRARDSLRGFHRTWGGVIGAIRSGEVIHPTHLDAYDQARKQLNIPSNLHPSEIPPEISAQVRMKTAQKHGSSTMKPQQNSTAELKAPQAKPPQAAPQAPVKAPERTLDYSKINQPGNKGDAPERTLSYDRRGNVKETVHPGAPDYKPTLKSSLREANTFAKSLLAKSPGLKQGSKLGRQVYDETANIDRKATRTGQEATGAGIRAEQTYGGKAGHMTAKDTAKHQAKLDASKNKKQPVKTELTPELKAQLEAQANAKSIDDDQMPEDLANSGPLNEFDPKEVKMGDRRALLEKAKKSCELLSKRCQKSWQVAGEVPSLKKELGRERAEDAKKAKNEKRSREFKAGNLPPAPAYEAKPAPPRPEPVKQLNKSEGKPFHGYNPKKHSEEGGLNDKAREKMNRETGSNLKRPVTEDNPGPKAAARKKSFCARMSGVEGPTSKEGKLTPKGASLKRWKCSKSSALNEEEESQKYDSLEKAKKSQETLAKRCWKGYEPTPGKKAYSEGSCQPAKKA